MCEVHRHALAETEQRNKWWNLGFLHLPLIFIPIFCLQSGIPCFVERQVVSGRTAGGDVHVFNWQCRSPRYSPDVSEEGEEREAVS